MRFGSHRAIAVVRVLHVFAAADVVRVDGVNACNWMSLRFARVSLCDVFRRMLAVRRRFNVFASRMATCSLFGCARFTALRRALRLHPRIAVQPKMGRFVTGHI